MASPAVTYTFTNGTASDATAVNQNFTDIINGITDGTKDLSINALTAAGNVSISGNTTLGNASGDDVTITGSLASTINIKTTNSYNIGSATLGLASIYFGANSQTVRILPSSSMSATWTLTLPVTAGTSGYYLKTDGAGVSSWQAFTTPTVQVFASGTGTYTTPASVKYIKVRMVGGGGGGGPSGTAAGTAGTTGTNTTFGTALLTANGGVGGGGLSTVKGGAGGSYTVNSPAISVISTAGGQGDGGMQTGTADGTLLKGGQGGGSYFGSGGSGGYGAAGDNGTLAGSGGAGGGAGNTTGAYNGVGGGAGGYVEAIIPAPSATYSYAVGGGGANGTAGTNGFAGGSGATGIIVVEEFYS